MGGDAGFGIGAAAREALRRREIRGAEGCARGALLAALIEKISGGAAACPMQ
jgi:hypothetical protein